MKQCITVDEQIALLKSHGVSFELMSESDAREFLYSRSYFFKIKSYERNYTRVDAAGSYTYSGLDFAHLVELSYLDFALSRICLSLALSTEHFLKVRLNQLVNSTLSAIQRLISGYCRQAERKLTKLTPIDYSVAATRSTHRDSLTGGDTDRADLSGLDARPQGITDAEVEVGPRGGCHAGGH